MNPPMNISQAGLDAIKRREGFVDHAYPDAGGFSIGYGHFGVPAGASCTEEQAEDWLKSDCEDAEAAVNTVQVALLDYQFDALVSFAYNVGVTAFLSSTLLKRLNSHNFEDVPNQMMRWVFSNGKESPALEARRKDEIAQWNGS